MSVRTHTILLLLMVSAGLSAQQIRYPEPYRALFNHADSVLSARVDIPVVVDDISESLVLTGSADTAVSDSLILAIDRELAGMCSVSLYDGYAALQSDKALLYLKIAGDYNIPVYLSPDGDKATEALLNLALWRRQNLITSPSELERKAFLYHSARLIQQRIFLVDSHADLPDLYEEGFCLGRRSTNQVSLRKMAEGGLDGIFLVAYQGQNDRPDSQAPAFCEQTLRQIHDDIAANARSCRLVRNPSEARQARLEGKKAIFIGIENGKAIGGDLSNIRRFAAMGVRYITLCHTHDNQLCHSSSHSADTTAGLTPLGREAVKEMNRLGVLIDCSHASSGTFWDCIALSRAPIICSHSGAKALFRHDRNLTDEQLLALRSNGGVVQVNAVWNFQGTDMRLIDIETFLDHIDHCAKVCGIDHVGIGLDMDGGGGYTGVFAANDAINITMGLLERGYSESDIEKIWSGNLFRVLDEAERLKD